MYRQSETIVATSTGSQRSSRLMSMYGANAFVCVPQGSGVLPQGRFPCKTREISRKVDVTLLFIVVGSIAEAILTGEVFATKPAWVSAGAATAKAEIDCCDHRHGHKHDAKVDVAPSTTIEYDPAGFRACVLTVSDRVSRGEAEDRSGPTACKAIAAIPGKFW